MTRDEILKEFEAAGAIMKGHFILSSGLHSDTYLQCARVLMDARRAGRLCAALAEKVMSQLGEQAIDMVVSPAMGGVVVGYEVGRQLQKEAVFCERVDGEFKLRRGFDIEDGAKVLLVEDVVTTGKSSLEALKCIQSYGGEVIAEACLVDRSSGQTNFPFPLISLIELQVETFPADKIPPALKDVPPVKPGSRWVKA